MVVYLTLFVLSAFLLYAADVCREHSNNKLVYRKNGQIRLSRAFFGVVAVLLLAIAVEFFRYGVGTDQLYYATVRIPQILNGTERNIPIGYQALVLFISIFTKDGLIIYGITTAIELILFFTCFAKLSREMWLSAVILYTYAIFNISLNMSRQMLAVAIVFWALQFLENKKYIKYLVCVAIATSIHTTSLLYIALIFLKKIDLKKTIIPIASLGVLLIFSKPFIALLEYISRAIPIFGKYYGYFSGSYFANDFSICVFFVTVAPLVINGFFEKRHLSGIDAERSNLYYNMLWIACIPGTLNNIIPNADRFVFMFLPVNCIYTPLVAGRLKGRDRLIYVSLMILVGVMFFLYYIFYLNCGETLPYVTWIGKIFGKP